MSRADTIRRELDAARRELLDFGLRNPLLNHRTTKARGLDVHDEIPAQVHRTLVLEGRAMSFLPAPDVSSSESESLGLFRGTAEMEDGEYAGDLSELIGRLAADNDEGGTAARHTDTKLQTPYSPAKLQSRLLASFYTARTIMEEQGVSVLYLALGMLEWYESESASKTRCAPLLLVPVELTRTDVRARFRVKHSGEDVGGNLTLQAKLKGDFGITIPLPDPEEDLDVDSYFAQVADAVSGMPRWRVQADAVHLGFFQFGKLLMYNDLDTGVWPADADPAEHEVVGALLSDGFSAPTGRFADDERLDTHVHPDDVHQVVDADSSQTLALLDVQQGNHLVIQGPPGTGKSQTITNVIAEAVGQGKTVLFVAEKMAALDVVKRRLDGVELGGACLELHSHKTNKKDLLADLQGTLRLGEPRADVLGTDFAVLVDARDQLNAYADAVNGAVGETGVSPFVAYGCLLELAERWERFSPPPTTDPSMLAWSRADFERRLARMEAMQALLATMGRPMDHPFWGSASAAVLPSDHARIVDAARVAGEATDALSVVAKRLAGTLGLVAGTPDDVGVLVRAARRALSAPDLRGVRVDAAEWHARRADVRSLIGVGAAYADVRSEYESDLIPEAWGADLLETRQHLAAHGEKWYRVFVGDWRRAKATLAGLAMGPLPKAANERLAMVDAVLKSQRLRKEVDAYGSLGAGLFGLQWQGAESDWAVLGRVAEWMGALHGDVESGRVPRGLIAFLSGGPDLAGLEPLVDEAEAALSRFAKAFGAAAGMIKFVPERRFGEGATINGQPFDALEDLADGWADNVERFQDLVTFGHLANEFLDDDLALFVGVASEWPDAGTHLVPAFEQVWFSTILDEAYATRPALAGFNGALHTEAARRFIDRDQVSLLHNRARLALGHWENLPRHGHAGGAAGQLGVLQREFSKKRRHMPIRKLMTEAGRAIQAIKPVFMMSPMSIAAYIPPGTVEFDLVVFDEASQVKPVDAFGALLRGKQAVVVGDSKQLPPTSFFDTVVGDGDADDASDTADVESVLELFKSKQAPERMLRWHYRSRHESLIAVSNKEFYENRLVTFPSPDASGAELGLSYHYLPNARYDKGGRRTNRDEARAVARAVAAHAASTPELSLMVATFSQAQQKEIRDQVEILSAQDPALNAFVNDSERLERFDVKNLENVQGDERDTVFISVGYGRDQNGAIAMNFGPLNREGGERRLNVLISRARRRCEVFTNLRADDIDLNRTESRGVAAFKRYLQFAATGQLEMAEPTGRAMDSPFEEAVARALRGLGYRIEPQVGVGSFRIDLAVVDPDAPGRYVIGIECDGATYHSALTARDRDRIRQSVLEGLGWRIHRIWSTDWFRSPEDELRRAVAAIERAKAGSALPDPTPKAPTLQLTRADEVPEPEAPSPTQPYVKGRANRHAGPLHEVPAYVLAKDVADVVAVESPVHQDEVARRIMEASGVGRMGSRIRKAVEQAARRAAADGRVERVGEFLCMPGQQPADVPVRDRSALPTASRSFDVIAPAEVRAAVSQIITTSFGIAAEDLAPEVCRLFGFGQTSAQMRAAVDDVLTDMQAAGTVSERQGTLTLNSLDSTDYQALL
ncbi:DUF3320 domain-containing protein [Rubricoccus marinus]|uniref:DNA helicase n=1 Tax=Rubricoccus marinus TaxID=716817 RepID=A0A259TX95_9BACT|nr:DUF3320 domain-containing protein [Rubricoccus marinus]OZC02389.1 hypothetical protein BSZ36_05005 [Rubricoccus marinus]